MVASHGTNTAFRANSGAASGTYFVSGPTLCLSCHVAGANGAYNNTATTLPGGTHGAGSAFSGGTGATTRPAAALNYCNFCHFSLNTDYSAANRPRYAQDVHGFNGIYNGTTWTYGLAANMRPVAFMRNTQTFTATSPRPYVATTTGPGQYNLTAAQAQCGGSATLTNGTISCSANAHTNYGPGGSY